jgi:hypothetical protein
MLNTVFFYVKTTLLNIVFGKNAMSELELKEFEKHYPADWIVIQNKVKECFKGMTLDEKRLFILATPYARTTKIREGEYIHISAAEFASACNIDLSTAYTALERATERIFHRFFSYVASDSKKNLVRWIHRAAYGTGGADIYFTDDILLLLRTFDAINPYTKYKKETVLRLKKEYSLDIYHLAKKAQNLGKFDLLIAEQIDELDLPKSYKISSNFKSRVLEPSIDEINTQTDITLSYEPIKNGKTIGYKIFIKAKETAKVVLTQKGRDKNTIDMFCDLTDAQINKYSTILCKLPELSDLSTFNDYPTFALWISGILRDPTSVREETAKRIFKTLHSKTDFK